MPLPYSSRHRSSTYLVRYIVRWQSECRCALLLQKM